MGTVLDLTTSQGYDQAALKSVFGLCGSVFIGSMHYTIRARNG